MLIARGGGGMRSDLFSAAGATKPSSNDEAGGGGGGRRKEPNNSFISAGAAVVRWATNQQSVPPPSFSFCFQCVLFSAELQSRREACCVDRLIDTSSFPTAVLDAQDGRQKKKLSHHNPPPPLPPPSKRERAGIPAHTSYMAGAPVCTHTHESKRSLLSHRAFQTTSKGLSSPSNLSAAASGKNCFFPHARIRTFSRRGPLYWCRPVPPNPPMVQMSR